MTVEELEELAGRLSDWIESHLGHELRPWAEKLLGQVDDEADRLVDQLDDEAGEAS